MKRSTQIRFALIAIAIFVVLLVPTSAEAVSLQGYEFPISNINSGGDSISSTNTNITATLGQVSSDSVASTNYVFSTGWLFALSGPYDGPIWYVSPTGSDSIGDGSSGSPYQTIERAMGVIDAGETISLAAGTYAETVVIDTDNITIIGVDSSMATGSILDFGDSTSGANAQGIYAKNRTGLVIRNLRIRNSFNGINFDTVTNSIISGVTSEYQGGCGIYLNASETNTIQFVHARSNNFGIYLFGNSVGNTIANSLVKLSAQQGIRLEASSNRNALVSNAVTTSSSYGINIINSNQNALTSNSSNNNSSGAFYFSSSNSNTIDSGTALNNTGCGIVFDSSNSNRILGGFYNSNNNHGIYLLTASSNNVIEGSEAEFNAFEGIFLQSASNENVIRRNIFHDNVSNGVKIENSVNNLVTQNTIDSNKAYAIYLTGTSATDTFQRNNLYAGVINPDSFAFTDVSGQIFDMTRNLWNTEDLATIDSRISTPPGDSIDYIPFRLDVVDTAAGADTIAPESPDTVSATVIDDTSISIGWATVATNEDGYGGAVNLSRYFVFRSSSANTNFWTEVGEALAPNVTFVDSNLAQQVTYFYRITAVDSSLPHENESYFSDSIASATTIGTGAANPCDSLIKSGNLASVVQQNGPDTDIGGFVGVDVWTPGGPFFYQGIAIVPRPGDNNETIAIIKYDASGNELACVSSPPGEIGAAAISFTGHIYISGQDQNGTSTVWRFDSSLVIVDSVSFPNEAGHAGDILVDTVGNVFIWNDGSGTTAKIFKYNANLTVRLASNSFNFGGSNGVASLAIDTASNFLYAQGGESNTAQRIIKYDMLLNQLADTQITGDAPYGGKMAVDTEGNVYVLAPNVNTTLLTLAKYDSNLDYVDSVTIATAGNPFADAGEPELPNIVFRNGALYFTAPVAILAQADVGVFKYGTNLNLIQTVTYDDGGLRDDGGIKLTVADSANIIVSFSSFDAGNDWDARLRKFSLTNFQNFIDTEGPNAWYVNDTSLTGDTLTSAVGSDSNDGLSQATPLRSISAVAALLTPGDTIFIDAGTYSETVVIDTDRIWIVGADSTLTILDIGDSGSGNMNRAIDVQDVDMVAIRGLYITNYWQGIRFNNVDTSLIWRVKIDFSGQNGIEFQSSVFNAIVNSTINENVGQGINFGSSSNNMVHRNTFADNSQAGIYVSAGSANIIAFNNALRNKYGINTSGSSGNKIDSNVALSNTFYGIYLSSGGTNHVFDNITSNNTQHGMRIASSSLNRIERNIISNNKQAGVSLDNSAQQNLFLQNTFDSNLLYQINIIGTGHSDSFYKNNFYTSPTNPDSVIFSNRSAQVDMRRNFWLDVDSTGVKEHIALESADSIIYIPFRLGGVDTALNADTVAPSAPDSVSVILFDTTSITINWSASTTNEEGTLTPFVVADYIIHRSLTADTSFWVPLATVTAPTVTYLDTGLDTSTNYFYRVTARDSSPIINESFYSDTIAVAQTGGAIGDTLGPNIWYVNDSSLSGDLLTTAVGDTANTGLSAASPKRNLFDLSGLLTRGDTIFLDAGTYAQIIIVDTDAITLRGADSSLTILDINDSGVGNSYKAIFADSQSFLRVENITIRNYWVAFEGRNIDSSTISNVTIEYSGRYGIYVDGGSDGNRIEHSLIHRSVNDGIRIFGGSSNTLINNTSRNAAGKGIALENSSSSNVIDRNTLSGNNTGLSIAGGSANVVSGNISTGNANGFTITSTANNLFTNNRAETNSAMGYSVLSSSGDSFTANVSTGNGLTGFIVTSSSNETFVNNVSLGDSNAGFTITASSSVWLDSNTSLNGNYVGFRLDSTTTGVTLNSNLANNNLETGFFMISSGGNLLTANRAETNGMAGFNLSNEGGDTLQNNQARGNAKAGFALVNSSGNFLNINVANASTDSGFYVIGGSSNNFTGNTAESNAMAGFSIASSNADTFTSNVSYGNTGAGFSLTNSGSNLFTTNRASSNLLQGMTLLASSNNTFTSNTIMSNTLQGLYLLTGSDTNTVSSNTISNNTSVGFQLDQSTGNTLETNTVFNNGNNGIYLNVSNNNNLKGNIITDNANAGISLSNGNTNQIVNNTVANNGQQGFFLSLSSDNVITNNVSTNNGSGGFVIFSTSHNNYLAQNTAESNASYGYYVSAAALADTFNKNIFVPSPYAISRDSGAFYDGTNFVDFTRNWWGTTDSVAIDSLIHGPGDSFITRTPFRIGIVDTTVGADTVAPAAPATVTLSVLGSNSIRVSWSAVSKREEPSLVTIEPVNRYNIYRSTTAGTSQWVRIGSVISTAITFDDSGLTQGQVYCYRVTSQDANAIPNESFYSDSIICVTPSAPPVDIVVDVSLPVSANVTVAGYDVTNVMSFSISGDTSGDTVTKFIVQFDGTGSVDSVNVLNFAESVALYQDANVNSRFDPTLDVLVGNLTWGSGNSDTFGNSNLSFAMPDWKGGKDSFVLVVVLSDTAIVSSTFHANIPLGGVKTQLRDSGPKSTPSASPATFTIVVTPTDLQVDPTKPTGAIISPTGTDLTGVMSMTISGAANDSLTLLQVGFDGNAGTILGIDTVFLYKDADSDGQFTNGVDSQITEIAYNAISARWDASGNIFQFGPNGADSFLIVVSLRDTATAADTLRAFIGADSVKTGQRGVTPNSQANAPNEFIVATAGDTSVVINIDQSTQADTIAPIAVDLTRVLAFQVVGDSQFGVGDTITHIEIKLLGNAGDISRLDYVSLYADANSDGNLDTAMDTFVTNLGFIGNSTFSRDSANGFTFYLGPDGIETMMIAVSLKDSAPSGETIWAGVPINEIKTLNSDSGSSLELFAPEAFPVFDLNPPAAFSLLLPANNSETNDVTPNLLWNASSDGGSGISSYEIQLSTSATFVSILDSSNTALNRIFTTSALTPGTYYWRARAYDGKGNANFSSDTFKFIIDTTAPAAPLQTMPADLAETTSQSIGFSWSASATPTDVMEYRIQTAADTTFASLTNDFSTGLSTSGTLSNLTAGLIFYWRVVARDTATNDGVSLARKVTIAGNGPTSPILDTPTTNHATTDTTIFFDWQAAADSTATITEYRIQIDQTGLFTSLTVDSTTGTNTSGTASVAVSGNYFWRVKVTNSAAQTSVSATRTFSVDTGVVAVLISPDDNTSTPDTTPTFVWTTDGDTSKFQIATDTTTPTIIDSSTQTAKTFQPTTILQSNIYFWRVIVFDAANNQETSVWRKITIDTASPSVDTTPPVSFSLIAPLAGQSGCTNVNPLPFSWNLTSDSVGVASYVLQVDTQNTFETALLIVDSTVTSTTSSLSVSITGTRTLFWRVIAFDAAGNPRPTASRELILDTAAPNAATPLSNPPSGSDTNATTILFRFTSSSDTTCGISHYKLQIDTTGTFDTPTFDTNTTSVTPTITGFVQDTWYWRVAAVDGAGNMSAWSNTDTFRVIVTGPAVPTLDSPVVDTTNIGVSTVVLDWGDVVSPISALSHYNVQVSTDSTFASVTTAFDTRTADTPSTLTLTGFTTATWYWRVNSQDAASNKSSYSATRSFVVDLGTPATPTISKPAASSFQKFTSVAIEWTIASTPASGIGLYNIVVNGLYGDTFADSTFAGAAIAQTIDGFGETSYSVKVRAQSGGGIFGSFSTAVSFQVDFTSPNGSPTLVAPISGVETTTTIVVFQVAGGTDTGSGIGQYKFEASKDSAFASILVAYFTGSTSTTFTPLFLFNDTLTTYFWRVAVVDKAGNVGPFSAIDSFAKPAPADTDPPVPIADLSATPNNALGILLQWQPSPSSDMASGGQYNIYWNQGNDSRTPDSILKIIPHVSSETYTFEISSETTLTDGLTYKFKVRAQDKNGNEESNEAVVAGVTRSAAAGMSYACIFNPQAGRKVYKPGGIQVVANLIPGTFRQYAETIVFQFSPIISSVWTDMKADSGAMNPQRIFGDSKTVYGMHWDAVGDSATPDTMYELRAVVTDQFGNKSTTLSCIVAIDVTDTQSRADVVNHNGKDTAQTVQKVDSRRSNTLNANAGSDTSGSVNLPANSLNATTDTSDARCTVVVQGAVKGDTTTGNKVVIEITSAIGNDTAVGSALTVELPEGQTTLLAGQIATLTLSYPPVDDTGNIPGVGVKPEALVVRAFSQGDSAVRSWSYDSLTNIATTTHFSLDTTNRIITFQTTRFSTFLLVVPNAGSGGPGVQASLSGFMVYPNPWRPNDGNAATGSPFNAGALRTTGIIFDNLPTNVKIEVYTLRGERVFGETVNAADGFATWNVQNKHTGRDVASGYYIYVVTDMGTGDKKTGKLAVIR